MKKGRLRIGQRLPLASACSKHIKLLMNFTKRRSTLQPALRGEISWRIKGSRGKTRTTSAWDMHLKGGVICCPTCSSVDRKSTRLNSSHVAISYAVFCVKKKIHHTRKHRTRLM